MKQLLVRAALVALLIATGPTEVGHYAVGPTEGGLYGQGAVLHAQDAHPTFTVGTATAQSGHKAYGVLKVPAGKDAGYDIPVVVLHGARPGPVLAVASGAHGTEYASIIAVERLIDAVDPAQLSGTLILLPLINVPSFERIVPHVNPTDNKSMNRFYPGDSNGTQTDRASFVITKEVVDRCDHLIDLHGGDLDENLRPYSYWTVTGNQKQDLENTASTRGKPSFTAEAGRSGPVEPKDAAVLVTGVQNVMGHLKMLARAAPPVAKPVWVGQIVTVAADRDGIFHPAVDRDAHVVKGAKIGSVTDYLNRPLQDVLAPESGIIMFVRALPSLKKGDTIANVGVVSKEPR